MRRTVILIADNDLGYTRSIVEGLLPDAEFEPLAAATVQEAISLLKTRPIDLVLADLRLTDNCAKDDFSGLDVADCALQAHTPCIVITAFPSVEATRRALHAVSREAPAVDFVPKRHGPAVLLRSVRSVLARQPFAILHISDLHFSGAATLDGSQQELSLFALRQDLKRLRDRKQMGRIRALVVSGDIVLKGDIEGYRPAIDFLNKLCQELMLEPGDAVVVPGNHDVERGKSEELKLKNFLDFTAQFYGTPYFTQDRLYRVFDFGQVAIVALSSCYRDGNPDFAHHVGEEEYYPGWIGPKQMAMAMEELSAQQHVLRIAVCHHHVISADKIGTGPSVSYLENFDNDVKPWLVHAGVKILLHGHGHRARLLQSPRAGTRTPLAFGSGTLLLPKDSSSLDRNQYLILNLGDTSRVIIRRYLSLGDGYCDWVGDHTEYADGIVDLPEIRL